jgi:dsRNA-specific ribonuclease
MNTLIKNLSMMFHPSVRKYLDLNDETVYKTFQMAFTHPTFDSRNNYEMLEQIGDVTIGKFLVNYFYSRFPHLQTPAGVKIIARLRIKYGSRQTLSDIAERFTFWPVIRMNSDMTAAHRRSSVLEDVFEAFIGAAEILIDSKISGLGYPSCFFFLSNVFDEIPIELTYEALFDGKTRIKELFDTFKDLGQLVYKTISRNDRIVTIHLYRLVEKEEIFMAEGKGATKVDAEQEASERALDMLSKQGFKRNIPREFELIN